MRRFAGVGGGLGVLGLSAVMTVLGGGTANAADGSATPPAAAAGESCWYAVDTGESLCVKTGEDLVAAVEAHRDVVARETLATSFVVREADEVVVELEVAGA